MEESELWYKASTRHLSCPCSCTAPRCGHCQGRCQSLARFPFANFTTCVPYLAYPGVWLRSYPGIWLRSCPNRRDVSGFFIGRFENVSLGFFFDADKKMFSPKQRHSSVFYWPFCCGFPGFLSFIWIRKCRLTNSQSLPHVLQLRFFFYVKKLSHKRTNPLTWRTAWFVP